MKVQIVILFFIFSSLARANDPCQTIAIAYDQATCYEAKSAELRNKIEEFKRKNIVARHSLEQMKDKLNRYKIEVKRLLTEKANKEKNVLKYDSTMEIVSTLLAFEKKINEMSLVWKKIVLTSQEILKTKINTNIELQDITKRISNINKDIDVFKNNLKFYLNEYQTQLASINATKTFSQIKDQVKSLDKYFYELDKMASYLTNFQIVLQSMSTETNNNSSIDLTRLSNTKLVPGTDLKLLHEQYIAFLEFSNQINFCKFNTNLLNCIEILKHENEILDFPKEILLKNLLENIEKIKEYTDLKEYVRNIQQLLKEEKYLEAIILNDSLSKSIGKVNNE